MEIKVNVDKKNKQKILQLISQLVDAEAENGIEIIKSQGELKDVDDKSSLQTATPPNNELEPVDATNLSQGKPHIEKSVAGSWGMFNSFLPGKVALRILARMVKENGGAVSFEKFMRRCIRVFKAKDFTKYRGFPKHKASSASRTEWHLIRPFGHLGLMEIIDTEKGELVLITEKGLEFSNLNNPILDGGNNLPILSEEEQKWLVNYLKSIELEGFQEYSLLKEFLIFLKGGHHDYQDLLEWFSTNKRMLEYLKTWSRKKDDPDAFRAQVENVAAVFVTGKIALLRELGMVSSKRNDYTVIREI